MAKKHNTAQLLKSFRLAKGEKPQEVAEAVGLTRGAIVLYEQGKRVPMDGIKVKLAKHFGTTVGFLFYGER